MSTEVLDRTGLLITLALPPEGDPVVRDLQSIALERLDYPWGTLLWCGRGISPRYISEGLVEVQFCKSAESN